MKVYQPLCKVTLIKTRARDKVSGDDKTGVMSANSARYKMDKVTDLTPFLSDAGVRMQKSVREPAGAFSIGLTTRPHSVHLETLDMLIEPMDMIEIRMAHEPPDEKATAEERRDWPPVVMRGFVSQVTRSESMANGQPQRSIIISGQDYGKLWQIMQIYYLNNSVMGDNIIHELKFFEKWAPDGVARDMSAKDFLTLVVDSILNPYLKAIQALSNGEPAKPLAEGETLEQRKAKLQAQYDELTTQGKSEISTYDVQHKITLQHVADMETAEAAGDSTAAETARSAGRESLSKERESTARLNEIIEKRKVVKKKIDALENETETIVAPSASYAKSITLKSSIVGTVTPFGVGNAQDMSFYQLLATFLDIGTFNELYIEDVGQEVALIARPQPVWRSNGLKYDESEVLPDIVNIGLGDVASTQLARSDSGVYNIFEVENARAIWFNQTMYRLQSMEQPHGHPLRLLDQNQEAKYFGERRLRVSTTLNNPALVDNDAKKKESIPADDAGVMTWLADRRERLVQLNRDASVLERGSLRLKGNHKLRAGLRLRVRHSSKLSVTYYVPSISHEYIPGAGFFTTAQVERGDGFVLSAGIESAPDLARRDLGGVK